MLLYGHKRKVEYHPLNHNLPKYKNELENANYNPLKYAVGTNDLKVINKVTMHGEPGAHEALMYNYGKGMNFREKQDKNIESINNKHSQKDIDSLDYSNYLNFRK
jgi:hypothetical protein